MCFLCVLDVCLFYPVLRALRLITFMKHNRHTATHASTPQWLMNNNNKQKRCEWKTHLYSTFPSRMPWLASLPSHKTMPMSLIRILKITDHYKMAHIRHYTTECSSALGARMPTDIMAVYTSFSVCYDASDNDLCFQPHCPIAPLTSAHSVVAIPFLLCIMKSYILIVIL